MIRLLTVVSLLAMCLTVGCTENTTSPKLDGRPLSLQDADRQYKARLLVLNDGQTTRKDVLSVMGDPDRVDDANHLIMFFWTVKDKDEEMLRRSFVIAQFNANDVLVRHRQFDDESRFGGVKLPDDALAEFLQNP